MKLKKHTEEPVATTLFRGFVVFSLIILYQVCARMLMIDLGTCKVKVLGPSVLMYWVY